MGSAKRSSWGFDRDQRRFREESERKEVEAFVYVDDTSLGLVWVTTDTIRAVSFVRGELDDNSIVINSAKTVTLQ